MTTKTATYYLPSLSGDGGLSGYLVQIKNNEGFVVSLGWISGQLTPDQKLSPSLSWTPNESGEFTTEIYVWEGLINHRALSQYTTLQINVS